MATRSSKTSSRSPAPIRTSSAAPRRRAATKPTSPPTFIWGASTASYQIEGAARHDGRGESVWDRFCRTAGRVHNGDTGDVACDHYHRFEEDVALMKRLGLDAYRFSVAWPRVLPSGRGVVNQAGLDFYDRLIDALLAAGIEPWLCLYHWDLPQKLQEAGGWTSRDCAGWFADYAAVVVRRVGDRVARMAPFNEAAVFTLFGYGFGNHAPGIADRTSYLQAIHHVNLAHGRAVDAWRGFAPRAQIGSIHNQQPGRPATPGEADRHAANRFDAYWNRSFPDPQHLGHYPAVVARAVEPWVQAGDMTQIARPLDWFGINFYNPTYLRAEPQALFGAAWAPAPPELPRTGMGWAIDPSALQEMLGEVWQRYRTPIYVLENGAGSEEEPGHDGKVNDQDRIDYLGGHIRATKAAREDGIDVRGYFVWSLLDNFEWAEGYSKRFGVIYVDYATQKRIPKASCEWLRSTIKASR